MVRAKVGAALVAALVTGLVGCGGSGSGSGGGAAARPGQSGTREVPLHVVAKDGEALATVAITIHGRGPYLFIVDTGASSSVIDADAARALHLSGRGKPSRVTGVSCGGTGTKVALDGWSAAGARLPAVKVLSTRLTLSKKTKGVLKGLLGSDVLSHFGAVRVDYRAQTMTLG